MGVIPTVLRGWFRQAVLPARLDGLCAVAE